MPDVTLKITLDDGGCVIRISIDNKRVTINNNKGSVLLKSEKQYSFVWFVTGMPGDTYKILITDPPQSKTTLSYTLDDTGKDGGQVWLSF